MCHLSTAFSAAAPPSEGRRLTLRSGPARQAYSDYSHYSPRHAGGMAGGRLRCITPLSCSPASLPGRSATGDTLCTSPSQRRPLRQPPSGTVRRDTRRVAGTRRGRPCAPSQAQRSLPPYPDADITTIVERHPYRRCRLTSPNDRGTGLARTRGGWAAARRGLAPPRPGSQ